MQAKLFLLILICTMHVAVSFGQQSELMGMLNNLQKSNSTHVQYPVMSEEALKNLPPQQNGFTVLNSTTGCLNYFFNQNRYAVCGNCIPKFAMPLIASGKSVNNGAEVTMSDSGSYRLLLMPDSILTDFNGKKVFIPKPETASTAVKHEVWVWHANETCPQPLIAKSSIQFTGAAAPTTIRDKRTGTVYNVLSVGKQLWLSEALSSPFKDEQLSVNINGAAYYNWNTLNADTFQKTKTDKKPLPQTCPVGFKIPSSKDVEELMQFAAEAKFNEKAAPSKNNYVVGMPGKQTEPTDAKKIFMMSDTDHPAGFHVMILENNEIRIASLPREVWVRILCVSEQ